MPVARSAAPAPNARRVTRGATESDRREMGSAHLVMCDRRDAERDAERRDGAARATPPAATQREKAIDAMGRNVRTGREARLGVVRGDERSKKIQVAAAQHEISITEALRLCDRTVCESNPVPRPFRREFAHHSRSVLLSPSSPRRHTMIIRSKKHSSSSLRETHHPTFSS
jgi:hypothetical protein